MRRQHFPAWLIRVSLVVSAAVVGAVLVLVLRIASLKEFVTSPYLYTFSALLAAELVWEAYSERRSRRKAQRDDTSTSPLDH